MSKKLNKEALEEIMELFNKVKKITKLMNEWHIHITSDPWTATSFSDKEDILSWKEKDFKELELYGSGDKFYMGGNIVTGTQHEYNNEWIIAPKELAEVQGKIFEKYLKSIIKPLKHFKLEFKDEYGLIDNCGWEHYMYIETTVKKSGLKTINENNFEKLTYKEIKKNDLDECKKWLKENKNYIKYDKEKQTWLIDDIEILDELWYEQKTIIHPKILINDIEKIIKEEII